jgi:hypothetical protein
VLVLGWESIPTQAEERRGRFRGGGTAGEEADEVWALMTSANRHDKLKGQGFDPFVALCLAHDLPQPLTEFLFLPGRRFRADYAWLEPRRVIVEREGGLFVRGRAGMAHAMPSSILRDMERSNVAQLAGFLYLRFTPKQLDSGVCLPELKIVLGKANA